tara:strand:+ start:24 stop:263 length:240 start_codon:yes stop_codon:yes gene_type:complete
VSDKKSYMSNQNILAEGFFEKLKSILKLDNKKIKTLKKDRKVTNSLKQLNKSWSDLAKSMEKDYGIKPNFEKFKLSDFI